MKKVFILVLLLALTANLYAEMGQFVNSMDGIKMFKTSSVNGSVLFEISYGEQVFPLVQPEETIKTGWVFISYKGKTGWVIGSFLSQEAVEKKSVIKKVPVSESLIQGTWIKVKEPFSQEELKFKDIQKIAGFFEGLELDHEHQCSAYDLHNRKYQGSWFLRENILYQQGKSGYYRDKDFKSEWDINIYKIRGDWLILEVRIDGRRPVSRGICPTFLYFIKPVSSRAERKVKKFWDDFGDSLH